MKIEDVTLAVVDALAAEQIPYMLVGSFSSNYYGIPRSTHDADFVIDLAGKSITPLRTHLGTDFKFDPQMTFETVTGTHRNVIEFEATEFKIELFRLSEDPHDRERFKRRQQVELIGRQVYLPTAEDVIITKLRWFRKKDHEDLQAVIAVQGDRLDCQYIRQWCEQHNTRERFEELLRTTPRIE